MLTKVLTSPPLHGQLGVLDELILFCLPVVIAIVVLAMTSQRARQKHERTQTRPRKSDYDENHLHH
ncbi:MAG: hypothetical protein ACRDGG_07555 [Anaerolineae bacterium]